MGVGQLLTSIAIGTVYVLGRAARLPLCQIYLMGLPLVVCFGIGFFLPSQQYSTSSKTDELFILIVSSRFMYYVQAND
jgi:hypothetical protein